MKHWKAHAEVAATRPPRASGARLRVLDELERWARVDAFEAPKLPARQADRSGALVGLVLVATACAGLCVTLYHVSGRSTETFVQAEGPID